MSWKICRFSAVRPEPRSAQEPPELALFRRLFRSSSSVDRQMTPPWFARLLRASRFRLAHWRSGCRARLRRPSDLKHHAACRKGRGVRARPAPRPAARGTAWSLSLSDKEKSAMLCCEMPSAETRLLRRPLPTEVCARGWPADPSGISIGSFADIRKSGVAAYRRRFTPSENEGYASEGFSVAPRCWLRPSSKASPFFSNAVYLPGIFHHARVENSIFLFQMKRKMRSNIASLC